MPQPPLFIRSIQTFPPFINHPPIENIKRFSVNVYKIEVTGPASQAEHYTSLEHPNFTLLPTLHFTLVPLAVPVRTLQLYTAVTLYVCALGWPNSPADQRLS